MNKLLSVTIFSVLIVASSEALSEESCKKIYESPVALTFEAKQDGTSIYDREKIVTGNSALPDNPTTVFYRAGDFSVELTPLRSCDSNLIIQVEMNGDVVTRDVPWNQNSTILGKAGTEFYVNVIAKKNTL